MQAVRCYGGGKRFLALQNETAALHGAVEKAEALMEKDILL